MRICKDSLSHCFPRNPVGRTKDKELKGHQRSKVVVFNLWLHLLSVKNITITVSCLQIP